MRAVLALVFVTACSGIDGPHLDGVTPDEGVAGDVVTISGSGFCGQGDCDPLPIGSVSFGIDPQVSATIEAWAEEEIQARVPQSVAPGEILIVVTVDGRSSNGVRFRVEP